MLQKLCEKDVSVMIGFKLVQHLCCLYFCQVVTKVVKFRTSSRVSASVLMKQLVVI